MIESVDSPHSEPPAAGDGPKPSIETISPVNAAMFQDEHKLGISRFEYLSARKDQSQEKLRLGVFALNGASLVALITAVSGSGSAAQWLGFTASTAPLSATGFAAGAILAGAALIREADRQSIEAAEAFARQSSAALLVALHRAASTPENWKKVGEAMTHHHSLPLVGFGYSSAAIGLQNLACGAWLFGIVVPLVNAFWH